MDVKLRTQLTKANYMVTPRGQSVFNIRVWGTKDVYQRNYPNNYLDRPHALKEIQQHFAVQFARYDDDVNFDIDALKAELGKINPLMNMNTKPKSGKGKKG